LGGHRLADQQEFLPLGQVPDMFIPEQNGAQPMVISIEPTKIGDQHYVAVTIGGCEMKPPRGPYADADTAEIVAGRMRRIGRALARGSSNDG
jgi:hypothetical protein